MLNSTVLTGHLGADPDVKFSGEGNAVANFSMAFQTSTKKGKKTNWIRVVCFNKLAEIVETYLHKGAKIGVIGTLNQNTWTTDEGVKKSNYQIIANSIEFIKTDGRGFENGILHPI